MSVCVQLQRARPRQQQQLQGLPSLAGLNSRSLAAPAVQSSGVTLGRGVRMVFAQSGAPLGTCSFREGRMFFDTPTSLKGVPVQPPLRTEAYSDFDLSRRLKQRAEKEPV